MARPNPNSKIQNPKLHRLVPVLLHWFSTNARDLPWRRTRDPYAIWVSEIMLQQTQVKTVIPYWEHWLRELPTVEAAAKASSEKIHKLWEGLGYYSRARNLQAAARQIVEQHNGRFPRHFDDALALPGIGRYTAGAICSIAFNQPKPILDGNVIRVLTRVFGIAENPKERETNARLWKLAEQLVIHADSTRRKSLPPCPSPPHEPHGADLLVCGFSKPPGSVSPTLQGRKATGPGIRVINSRTRTKDKNEDDWSCSHLNQSLMELGALVCLPRNPQCDRCPVNEFCFAFRNGCVENLPHPGKRAAATPRTFVAFVIERKGRFLVRQRPAGVVNGRLWEFPNVEIGARTFQTAASAPPARRRKTAGIVQQPGMLRVTDPRSHPVASAAAELLGSPPESLHPLCTVKHSITRYRITMDVVLARLKNPPRKIAGRWRTISELETLAFSSAHKRILAELKSPLRASGSP